MKPELQKELTEKIKPGIKPSQLKRAKSLSDIPKALSLPTNLGRSKSAEELKPVNNSKEIIQDLESKISVLELKLETSQRELTELNSLQAENTHLKEQGKIKQQEVEDLRKSLEEITTELSQIKQELDESLVARHQSLKDWNQAHQKAQTLNSELNSTVEKSTEELINSDQAIKDLRGQVAKLQCEKQSLQRDLNLSSRLAEMRKVPYFENDFNPNLIKYLLYSVMAVSLVIVLLRRKND